MLLAQPPKTTLNHYKSHKSHLLNVIDPPYPHPAEVSDGHLAIERANHYVLERLKEAEGISPAEQSAPSGRERVERAIDELNNNKAVGRRGGILGLLEGAGQGY